MLIYLCGVNGVGKTSIIDQLQETTNITLVKGSKLLMERLGIKNEDYSALQQIPSNIKDDAFLAILSTLANAKGVYLLDSHILNLRNGKIVDVFSEKMSSSIDVFILVDVPYEVSYSRLSEDRIESRALFDKEMKEEERVRVWEEYVELTRKKFYKLQSDNPSKTFAIVSNMDIDSSVSSILNMVEERRRLVDKEKFIDNINIK